MNDDKELTIESCNEFTLSEGHAKIHYESITVELTPNGKEEMSKANKKLWEFIQMFLKRSKNK